MGSKPNTLSFRSLIDPCLHLQVEIHDTEQKWPSKSTYQCTQDLKISVDNKWKNGKFKVYYEDSSALPRLKACLDPYN